MDVFTVSGQLEAVRLTLLCVGCLLCGYELGATSHVLEPPLPSNERSSAEVEPTSQTGFAKTACLGSEIPNARGGWSVVFEPGEC